MSFGGMFIHRPGRLGARVAIGAAEIERADAVLAGHTLERDAPVHRFRRVTSHITIVDGYSDGASGH